MKKTPRVQAKMDLESLIANAKRNEQVLKQFQQMELKLLACRHWQGLFDTLFVELPEQFRLDRFELAIYDPNQRVQASIARQLGGLERYRACFHFLPCLSASQQQAHHLSAHELMLTSWQSGLHLPLRKQRQHFGYVRMLSACPERFTENRAIDFIEHFTVVLAACIELVLQTEEIERLAYEDPLTQARNRRGIGQAYYAQLARTNRQNSCLGMALVDLDHFKQVNDEHGHATGDRTLVHFCQLLKQCLRPFDYIGRMGGEEFLLILPECEPEQLKQVVNRVRLRTAEHAFINDQNQHFQVTLSGGFGHLQGSSPSLEAVTARLDKALYEAKHQGRNRMQAAALKPL